MSCRFRLTVISLGLLFALGGCQKPADQSASGSPDSSSSGSPSAASSGKNERREAAISRPVVIPAETMVSVVLDEALSSKTAANGQTFSATVSTPVEVEGRVAIPKGARATGIVREAKSAGKFKGGAVLSVALTGVTVGNANYDLQTAAHTFATKGKGKRTAEMIGGGGAVGALIGGLAGGGKGAAIGAAVGAGGGTAGAGLTGNNRDIELRPETPLSFKLLQPLELKH